jgi:hypothetical protein
MPEPKDLLSLLHPLGPWVLSAIKPDAKGSGAIETLAFLDLNAAWRWVRERDGKANLYFLVNEDLRPPPTIKTKAKKDNIARAVTLHIDIDCGAAGKHAAMKRLTEFDLKPTAIIDSGNGLHAYWMLATPLAIADANHVSAVESANRWLAAELGGDHCWNIDRILRVPGTTNLPDAKKRVAGVKPCHCILVDLDKEARYSLADFGTLANAEGAPVASASSQEWAVMASFHACTEVADLRVLDACKPDLAELIRSGGDGDDRSATLFSAIMSLIYAGQSAENILAIITDPELGIAESVLEKPNPMHYAKRQLARGYLRVAAESSWES